MFNKRFRYIFIVIISTIISIGIMVFSYETQGDKENNKINTYRIDNSVEQVKFYIEENTDNDGNKIIARVPVKNEKVQEKLDRPSEIVNTDNINQKEKNISVFKVNKKDIIKSLSTFEKGRLFSIASKLSSDDCNSILNLLKNDNQGEEVIHSMKILKDKLSFKDFEKLKHIAEKYINMEALEQY